MEERVQKFDLTQGVIWKKLLLFFLPIAVGTLFQQLYNTVDAMVVGKFVGKEALAAVGGSASQVINLCIGFFVALTGGAGAVISQFVGGRQSDLVSKAVHSALAFSILAGLVLTVLGVPLTPTILSWMNTPADTMADSVLYLRIYFGGTVFLLLFNMGSGILRAVGDSQRPLYYLVVCCFCNIGLDLLFVIGLHMGIAGAAWATVLSQALSTGLIFRQLCRTREAHRVFFRQLRIHGRVMKRMLMIGIPSGLQASMYNIANLIIQVAINSLGTVVVASWSITNKVDGIYGAMSGALGLAVMSFVGQNYGARKMERVQRTFRVGMTIFMLITVVVQLSMIGIGRTGLSLFNNDPEVIECTYRLMAYFVLFYPIWTFIEVISGVMRGIGDVVIPVTITAVGICVFRLVWIATVFQLFHTADGLVACYPVSWLCTATALGIYYRRGNWLKRRQAEDSALDALTGA